MSRFASCAPILLVAGLLACSPDTELLPTDAELIPERTLMGAALRDHFAHSGHWYRAVALDAPTGATRVGLMLELEADASLPTFEARGFDAAGEPGTWRRADITWHEDRLYVGRIDLGMDAFSAELRASSVSGLRALTYSAVVPVPRVDDEVASVASPLRSDLADLVNDRASWGARATTCTSRDPNKTRMAIHHTVTPSDSDPATRLRGIQAFHMDTNGWCDIGYHFLISLDGRIWEGRDLDLLGTHVGGHNTGNVGVSFIGCFHSSGCMDWTPFSPPEAMIDSAAAIVGRITEIFDINIDATNVIGHRDHAGATTACPGDNLHARLGDIRSRAGSVGPGIEFRATYVNQTFPLASMPFVLEPGQEVAGNIELRNDGSATWNPGETFLATTEPRDGASPLAAGDWVAPNRPATVDRVVGPGETGRFEFSVRAPITAGDHAQFFNLVNGTTWFSDPGQGGPPDDQLQVRVMVSMDGDAGPPPMDAGPTADAGTAGDAGADAGLRMTGESGGCGCRTSGGADASWLLALVVLGRRRRT